MSRGLRFAAIALLLAGPVSAAFDPGEAGFAVRVKDERNPYRVLALFVSPGEELEFVVEAPERESFTFLTADAPARPGRRWRWRAPDAPSVAEVRVVRTAPAAEMLFHVVVTTPYRVEEERVNGFLVGRYPRTALRGLAIYRPPGNLVEVTPARLALPVSPHFTLGQFLCKQEGGFPKYLVLRERLVLKLEYLLGLVNEAGIRADTFFVMSGYRTPAYNAALGNVEYSRHLWGGAADIFIDESPRDGRMDDLDGNGRVDLGDAEYLHDLFDSAFTRIEYESFIGGLGLYDANAYHGPFVHVDARGFRARW